MFNRTSLRKLDRETIRDFVSRWSSVLTGHVLDYGCGKAPYRDLVTGEYEGYDLDKGRLQGPYNAILCTQVIQEIDDPFSMLPLFYDLLNKEGHVVLTYNINWEEYGYPDRWRFTKDGMEELAHKARLTIVSSELRYGIPFEDFVLPIGRGIVLKK